DESATALFVTAFDAFENELQPAFEDAESWVMTGFQGNVFTPSGYRDNAVCKADALVNASAFALQQWSTAAVQKAADQLISAFEYTGEIIRMGMYVVLDAVTRRALRVYASMAPVAAGALESATTGGAVAAPSEDTPEERQKLASSLEAAKLDAAEVIDKMALLTHKTVKLFEALTSRVGAIGDDQLDRRVHPLAVQTDIEALSIILDNVASYGVMCSSLKHISNKGQGEGVDSTEYSATLSKFCRLHNRGPTAVFDNAPSDFSKVSTQASAALAEIKSAYAEMYHEVGSYVFSKHVSECTNSWVQAMSRVIILAHPVHSKALHCEGAEEPSAFQIQVVVEIAEKAFRMLTHGADIFAMIPEYGAPLTGEEDDIKILDGMPHNVALRGLQTFSEDMCIEVLDGVGLKVMKDGALVDEQAPIEVAISAQGLFCATFDVAASMALVLKTLKAAGEEKKVNGSMFAFGKLVYLQRVLQQKVALLDETLRSDSVLAIEKGGFVLPTSLVVLEPWLQGMSAMSCRLQNCIVATWCEQLGESVGELKTSCPEWRAIFKDGQVDWELAKKVAVGQSDKVVKKHNAVHSVLQSMADKAAFLEISGPLSSHKIAGSAVAVAMSILKQSATTSIVCLGFELLAKYRDHNYLEHVAPETKGGSWKNVPEAFLQKHNKPEHSDVPECFWEEFKMASQHWAISQSRAVHPPKRAEPEPSKRLEASKPDAAKQAAVAPAIQSAAAVENVVAVQNVETPQKSKGLKRRARG
ncbi:unnamed protein product, partial [Prorocentrum cordatum]